MTIRPQKLHLNSRLVTALIVSLMTGSSVFGIVHAVDTPSVEQLASDLIISALQTGTCAGNPCVNQPTHEFVELYNPTETTLTVENWIVRYLPTSGNVSSQKVLATLDGTIAPKSYALIGHLSLMLAADFTFGATDDSGKLADSGGHIEILNTTGAMVDRIGWGSGSKLALGSYAPKPSPGQQLRRITNQSGHFINTQNNGQDFVITSLYAPQAGGFKATPPPDPDPEPTTTCDGVVISEILPNPDGSDSGLEFIELHNPTNSAITLAGCTLHSGSQSYDLEGQLLADQYRALSDSVTSITLPNSSGGEALLSDATTDLHIVNYPGDLDDDTSWAFADGSWAASYTPTPNQPNIVTPDKPCADGQVRNFESGRCTTTNPIPISASATCPAGQERNPETNRCRSTNNSNPVNSLTPCKEGQERNPETNRCRASTATANNPQPCPQGQERNPDTNRCRKLAAAGTTNSNGTDGMNGIQDIAANASSNGKPYKLIIIAALGAILIYGIYEWRQELHLNLSKLWRRVRFTKPITSNTPLR